MKRRIKKRMRVLHNALREDLAFLIKKLEKIQPSEKGYSKKQLHKINDCSDFFDSVKFLAESIEEFL